MCGVGGLGWVGWWSFGGWVGGVRGGGRGVRWVGAFDGRTLVFGLVLFTIASYSVVSVLLEASILRALSLRRE